MRTFGLAVIGSALLLAGPALASGIGPGHMNLPSTGNETGAGEIHAVKPGDSIDVACAALAANPGADVRVVLTLAPVSGETKMGYQKLMATNEQIVKNAVRFRVPETNGIENHTVHLKVYVVGDKGAQSCDGGLIKIV
ncbi:MAG TPA: hypothetical protein VMS78_08325 [Rhizomicrobium sp.]|nr:hypothetical protein [Rhizomicrobium sp.]